MQGLMIYAKVNDLCKGFKMIYARVQFCL